MPTALNNKPPSKRRRLWHREGKVCHWCRKPTRYGRNGWKDAKAWDIATNDHVIPRYKGGRNDDDNLVSACRRCNNRRAYEDTLGLPEGSLLGHYPPDEEQRLLHKIRARKNREILRIG